ncbi:MAG: tetratricopeptide repeat protein [Bacteroidota bacterium]
MDVKTVIAAVRKHIKSAELEEAFLELERFFATQPAKFAGAKDTLVQIQAQYNKTNRDASLGILSSDEAKRSYNQSINQILILLDDIEVTPAERAQSSNRRSLYAILGMMILVVVAIVLYRTLNENTEPTIPPDQVQQNDCPSYEMESIFNIMILPFRPFDGNFLNVHKGIQERLGVLSDEENIKISPKILPIDVNDPSYPKTANAAKAIADNCKNTRLVIWGTTEQAGDQVITRTRFKFLDIGEFLKFTKLEIEDNSLVDTISTISSIPTEGQVTGEIEALILGIIAHMTNRSDAAIAWLEDYHPTDSSAILTRGMILADSYLKHAAPDSAMDAYNEVLKVHPQYALARNNRGLLYFNKGDYTSAIADLDVSIEKNPTNLNALAARGVSLLKTDHLAEAQKDLKAAQEKAPDDLFIRGRFRETASKIEAQVQEQQAAKRTLRRAPNNKEALKKLAESSAKIGDYETTEKTANRLLEIDPNSLPAFISRIKAALGRKDIAEAKRIYDQAIELGMKPEELLKGEPMLKNIIPLSKDNALNALQK